MTIRNLQGVVPLLLAGMASALACYEEAGEFLKLGMQVANHNAWSALAISGNGGMKGAREIVVRKENDAYVAEDRYSLSYSQPELSPTQDVKLIFAKNEGGHTSWAVLLPMNACKGMSNKGTPMNYEILDIRQKMLWALGSTHSFGYHGSTRGSFEANLISGPVPEPSIGENTVVDLRMPNVTVETSPPATDLNNPYICGVFDLNEYVDSSQKLQAVKIEPVLNPDTEKYCHHMLLIVCDSAPDGFAHNKVIKECMGMPEGCYSVKYPWAVGSLPLEFPENVGMPFGMGKRWLVIQFHYYMNPVVSGVKDNSGIRIHFAKTLRPVNAGMAFLNGGANEDSRDPLPAGKSVVVANMTVPAQCTNKWDSDVTVLSSIYHGHLVGMYFDISVRRNNEYVGSLRYENGYDFQHQSLQESPTKTIKKGDELHLHCQYDTSTKTSPVKFGDFTDTEMCVAFFAYYPAQPVEDFSYQTLQPSRVGLYSSSCLSAGTGEYSSHSSCIQVYMEDVVQWLGFGSNAGFGAEQLCVPATFSQYANQVPFACPTCWQDNSCTKAALIQHGTEMCGYNCRETLGLSLYPDTSDTTPNVKETVYCGDEGVNFVPVVVHPPQCQHRGILDSQAARDIITSLQAPSPQAPSPQAPSPMPSPLPTSNADVDGVPSLQSGSFSTAFFLAIVLGLHFLDK
eukprot:TRINITY_DN3824_c0_g2_i4.p1 TRINITY_DN3824_c0_g2~~TRINITY_DN3824_c0_g2_i4.p1  ORF type:complete len:681 (-),score=104.86 TRINITY_DN3824_c0_g2_i4:93-2135(-)